jgi:predicted RNA-binding Zn-ribbon protein involved in translation (DUF1610 family)
MALCAIDRAPEPRAADAKLSEVSQRNWGADRPRKARKREMSKQALREETERLVKEALERKAITIKQGKTRIESKCAKCGALCRVSAVQGQVRVPYTCKECGEKQRTF